MKRNLFYFAAGVLALSACTSEDVVNDVARTRNVIGFENVVKKSSRADDITNSQFKQFYVFGYYNKGANVFSPVFENTLVTRLATNDGWSYYDEATGEDYRHWIPGAKYHFFAYSVGNGAKLEQKVGGTPLSDGTSTFGFEDFVCDAENQSDLIFAYNCGSDNTGIEAMETGNTDVSLNFAHILTKVNATFSSGFPKGYEVKISNVTISNIYDKGDFLYQPGETATSPVYTWNAELGGGTGNVVLWAADADPLSVVFTNDASTNSEETNSAYVIPHKYNDPSVCINFSIEVIDNGNTIISKNLVGKFKPNWLPGYTYTYNIEVDGDAANLDIIGFSTAVDEDGNIVASKWGNGDTSDADSKISFK